ncbi:MAG: hypothetical protein DRP47_04885 [Candidatus Zixiibacteriota bacterium]|nr:MAG: hypothetical protein DRP47_04885 [candidate division Zixibacteria bacterium]
MSQYEVLRTLEGVLESFLERVVLLKKNRLDVLEGINSLDDIAQSSTDGFEITDRIGEWFAEHNRWLTEDTLKTGDIEGISRLLSDIKTSFKTTEDSSPAKKKISSVIDRWDSLKGTLPDIKKTSQGSHKMVLKRGAEQVQEESIALFDQTLKRCLNMLARSSINKKHLLSALDDSLRTASIQKNKDALLLSAFAIYYLKQNGYKIEPYVKRLKEAERLLKGNKSDV